MPDLFSPSKARLQPGPTDEEIAEKEESKRSKIRKSKLRFLRRRRLFGVDSSRNPSLRT